MLHPRQLRRNATVIPSSIECHDELCKHYFFLGFFVGNKPSLRQRVRLLHAIGRNLDYIIMYQNLMIVILLVKQVPVTTETRVLFLP